MKKYSDSTLKGFTKDFLIKTIRCLENNLEDCEYRNENQFRILCQNDLERAKYRWHDLRKDPTDLPQDIDTKMVCIISCSNPKGRRLYTDLRYIQEDYGWGVNPVNYEVIAWREIEPFEEIQL